jgi:hypothetical protein
VQWVDYDNDGDLDVHLMNRGTIETGNEPDVLWCNDGLQFHAVTGSAGVPGLSQSFTDGGCWADFDRDGDLDVIVQEGFGPLFFTTGAPALLYRNDGPAGNWFACTLDRAGTRTAVGTKVTVWSGSQRVHRRLEANTWRGFQEPNRLHFGLGTATVIDSLVVEWPQGPREVLGRYNVNFVLGIGESGEPTSAPSLSSEIAFVGPMRPQPASGNQSFLVTHRDGALFVVDVFDVSGRWLRTLAPEPSRGGSAVDWDGRDARGVRVPAGVYFLRAEGDLRFVRKAVRLR